MSNASSSLSSAEAELSARIRAGDESAFTQLVHEYANGMLQVAYRVTTSEDTARDAVQNTLSGLWRRRITFHPQQSFKSYLYRAVRNDALKLILSRRDETDLDSIRDMPSASEESLILDRATVERLLDTLPERRRVALQLRFLEQMSYQEIGDVLEISAGAAEQLVIRTLRDLRQKPGAA